MYTSNSHQLWSRNIYDHELMVSMWDLQQDHIKKEVTLKELSLQ